jgi:hypothetical protein
MTMPTRPLARTERVRGAIDKILADEAGELLAREVTELAKGLTEPQERALVAARWQGSWVAAPDPTIAALWAKGLTSAGGQLKRTGALLASLLWER